MSYQFFNLSKYLLKIIIRSIMKPSFRYSWYFQVIQNILSYTPREKIIENAMGFVAASQVEGDYMEFGVYKGMTFISAFHIAQKTNLKSMNFYAFDSFQGLPEITEVDSDIHRPFSNGDYSCDANKFKKNISLTKVDLSKVKIISGWYDEVLNEETKKKFLIKKASIVWIDCDLYKSTVSVLNFITNHIEDGTIIVFDDWFCFRGNPNKGEQKAFTEWLKKNPSIKVTEFHKFGWHGNSFIVHRN